MNKKTIGEWAAGYTRRGRRTSSVNIRKWLIKRLFERSEKLALITQSNSGCVIFNFSKSD